jgi:O-antigen ligase
VTAAAVLLALPFAGLLLRGYRPAEAWLLGACALAAALWALRGRLSARPLLFWAPWLAWAALSGALSGQPQAALGPLSRWLAALAALSALPQLADDSLRRRWRLALGLSAPALALAALWTGWTDLRAHGTGEAMTGLLPPYYNYTAFWLAAAGAAGPAAVSGFSAAYLLVARARGALLALLVGAAVSGLRGRAGKAVWLGGAVVLLAIGAVLGPRLLKRDKAYAAKRPQIWKAALRTAADGPLLGEGPGQFEAGFRRHMFEAGYGMARYRFSSAYAHSEPLQLAAETGFAGALLFALGLFLTLRRGYTATPPLAAAAAMGTQCLVDNMLQIPALALLLASALGLALKPDASKPGARDRAVWSGAAVLLAVLAAGAFAARGLPAPHEALESAARERQSRGDLPGALAALDRAVILVPYNALDQTWRGELLKALGRPAEAEAAARKALELEPDALQARLLLSELLFAAGRISESKDEMRELERRHADQAQLDLQNRSSIYTDYDRALASVDHRRFFALRRRMTR